MTGDGLNERYWPTASAYALAISCEACGELAFSCPCAVADNDTTGQGPE